MFKINELKKDKIYLIIGLIGIIIIASSILFSIFSYPNYSIVNQYLSELGHPNATTATIFNLGLMIGSILMIPFFYYFFYKEDILSKLIFVTSIFSMIALFGVGFFPLTLKDPHFIFAGIFFFTCSLICILFLIKQILDKNFLQMENLIAFFCAISSILFIILIRSPVMQKISVAFILLFILVIIIKQLTNQSLKSSVAK